MLEISKRLWISGINKEGTYTTTPAKLKLNSMHDWLLILDNADDDAL